MEENVAADPVGDEGRKNGVKTEVESSETTPNATIYTKHPPSAGGGGTSRTRQSLEYQHVEGASRDTHNPACDDLPHAPQWELTQGSRLNDINNCREFFSLSLPPAERMFQKRSHRMDLLDDHFHVGVKFYATSQEIVRERQLMGEDTLEFKYNAKKKGLLWRVSDAEDKLVNEKQFNENKQKEWEIACERTNREMQNARDQIQERALYQKRENEYLQRIAKLEKFASEKVTESKASEILAEETAADCKWLLARVVPLISERIAKSDELARYMYKLGEFAY
ncbi:hypothetical protein Hanom_Chr12g01077001 [Helianthus anomalus]